MNKSILAFVVVAVLSAKANAGMVTTDRYTITYDDTFWGVATGTATTWSSNKNTLTFSNLGLGASVLAGRFGEKSESASWWSDWNAPSSLLTITANNSYKIASVRTGATGVLTAIDGGTSGAYAWAQANVGGYWDTGSGDKSQWFSSGASVDASSSNQGRYKIQSTTDLSIYSDGESPALASRVFSNSVDTNIQSATLLHFYADVYASAFGQGSESKASLGALTFTFDVVSSVPEPESYAMLLAGLGIMGAVARRRSKKA